MQERRVRMLGFLGMHLVYFPLLAGVLHLLHGGLQPLMDVLLPRTARWVFAGTSLAAAGALYVALGYATAYALGRRFSTSGRPDPANDYYP